MVRKARFLGALILLLSWGCAEAEPSSIHTARTRMKPLVDAACEWMFGCCSPDELVYQVGEFTVDAEDCSERLLDAIAAGEPLDLEQGGLSVEAAEALLVLARSIDGGRVDVDGDAVRRCADATIHLACNAPVVIADGRCTPSATVAEADPCDPEVMFRGRRAAGEECDAAWECEEGLHCIDLGLVSVCAPRAAEGERCFSDEECADGLLCDWTTGTCAPGALSGEACAFANPLEPIPGTETVRCVAGLSCDPVAHVCKGGFCAPGSACGDIFSDSDCPEGYFCVGNSFAPATCREPGSEGAPCFKRDDCQSGFCDPASETCGVRLTTGEPCFDDFECESGFCEAGTAQCNPSVPPGQPCPSFDDAECRGGYCDQDPTTPTCQTYSGEDGPCSTGVECDPALGLSCIEGTCLRPPFDEGVSCADGAQCASGICHEGECASGAPLGAACRTDGTIEPCIVGGFCATPSPSTVDGTCTALSRSGEDCTVDAQCWGACIIRFGQRMCDATPAFALDEVWCDGV